MTSSILSAPIRAGGASPLRVATGGNASSGSKARCRRSPARTNRRRDERCGWPQEPSPLRGFEGFATGRAALTYIGHLFMTKPRASLRSETCPISIGIGVRYGLEQVSELIGMRTRQWGRLENSGKRCRNGAETVQIRTAGVSVFRCAGASVFRFFGHFHISAGSHRPMRAMRQRGRLHSSLLIHGGEN